ncbi:hypothetical protein AK829_08230 [Corynebacterium riegelii]|uniref:Anti-sigma K factor RskA C-terminal domain-containing protein n=1 Tax=Corynebacterium riegelii TaxID=156976 RepID=A0A0K1REU3_9CORY|nr:hypothetical protein AK829_08230 [Corynebacterium riegelii]
MQSFAPLFDAAATPIAPPPSLKSDILQRIAETPQRGEQEAAQTAASAEIIDLSAERDLQEMRRSRTPARKWFAAAAATILVFAGAGVVINQFNGSDAPDSTSVVAAPGIEEMHAVMSAADVRQGKAEAGGAILDIVVSNDMNKGGAMVNGQPDLEPGMGAQVWAVMSDGATMSAGVIGQDPHTDVWMPLPGDATSVLVTEEVSAGVAEPTGRVLAHVKL